MAGATRIALRAARLDVEKNQTGFSLAKKNLIGELVIKIRFWLSDRPAKKNLMGELRQKQTIITLYFEPKI